MIINDIKSSRYYRPDGSPTEHTYFAPPCMYNVQDQQVSQMYMVVTNTAINRFCRNRKMFISYTFVKTLRN